MPTPPIHVADNKIRRSLKSRLDAIRGRTYRMTDPLDDDDVHKQFNTLMSPIVWDMGHVANFEEYWLLRELDGRRPHDENLDEVYNPFDNPRWVRADLPILDRTEATRYLDDVRGDALALMEQLEFDPEAPLLRDGYVWNMVAQHEAQHQETVLQALDLRDDLAPYVLAGGRSIPARAKRVDDTERVVIPAGEFAMGTDDTTAAYDNERPLHRVYLGTYGIDKYPVTVRRYAEFIAAGGYSRPDLWSDAGWLWLGEAGHGAPQGWVPDLNGGWLVLRFGHLAPLDPAEPVEHVSFHEAEAFARWAGGRLPTEAEWEKAAVWDPARGTSSPYPWGNRPPSADHANLDHVGWGPAPVGSYPAGASAFGLHQTVGDVYEWTTSYFDGYPGYTTFPYPEYSEVFFGTDYRVLRGSSWATSASVARATFRNWDLPIRRQIFAGLRVAWDVG